MIEVERQGLVTLVRLHRPERRNAVDAMACDALVDAVDGAAAAGARALVLAGMGPHFCAGADLGGLDDHEFTKHLRRALDALREAPLCTIAAVHGVALGAGMQLAIACDLRVAAPGARFGIPAARLGLMVDHWTVERVALLAGHGPARAVLLACEEIEAEQAVSLGLASRLGELSDALGWAREIAELAPLTIRGHKLSLNRLERVEDAPDVSAAFRRAWESDDLREGRAAFAEKRRPRFEGR